jgi:hypothetical protein
MALALLFNRRPRRQGRIGQMVLDVTISENHDLRNRITQWPVEDGSTITDHIANEPRRITLNGFIADSPLNGSGTGRAQRAFDDLERMWRDRELIDVVTQYRSYSRMGIDRVAIPKDGRTGDGLRFVVELVEVRFAASETVDIPADSLPPVGSPAPVGDVADQAQSPTDTGRQTTTPAEQPAPAAPAEAPPGSLLYTIIYGEAAA